MIRFELVQKHADLAKVVSAMQHVEKILDPEDILDQASSFILAQTRKRFLKEQDPNGKSWPQSKAASVRRAGGFTFSKGGRWAKGGKFTATGTLFASGNLFHSIQLVRSGKLERSIQSDVEYGIYHQMGGREFIGASDKDLKSVTQIIMKQLETKLNAAK